MTHKHYNPSAVSAARIAVWWSRIPHDLAMSWWWDIVAEAQVGLLVGGEHEANLAAQRFIYRQVTSKGLTGGSGQKFRTLRFAPQWETTVPGNRIPVIALARLLYRLLKKKGKRGRHSAALKALILADRADGISFVVIAELRGVSVDLAKRHYRKAWTMLRQYLREHQSMLSPEQHRLLIECCLHLSDLKEENRYVLGTGRATKGQCNA